MHDRHQNARWERILAMLIQLRARTISVHGHTLNVPAGVLDPVRFRTGAAWAPWVAERVRERTHPSLLDMGCGTGIIGVVAQKAGAEVVAVDIDHRACGAARINGLADVRRGDLFRPVLGQRFDIICFNPPFFQGHSGLRPLSRALMGGPNLDVIERFAAGTDRHLRPGGVAWTLLSDRAPAARRALGPGWSLVHQWSLPLPDADPEALEVWARSSG